jgi:hypothetical protein
MRICLPLHDSQIQNDMKKKLLFGLFSLYLTATFAQIPTSGLVASFPFTGNANDASGNGNNGTVTGATLTTDRFGNAKNSNLKHLPIYRAL